MNVTIHIERLVLDGVTSSGAAGTALADAVRVELVRRFAAAESDGSWRPQTERQPRATFRADGSSSAAFPAPAIAHAVYAAVMESQPRARRTEPPRAFSAANASSPWGRR